MNSRSAVQISAVVLLLFAGGAWWFLKKTPSAPSAILVTSTELAPGHSPASNMATLDATPQAVSLLAPADERTLQIFHEIAKSKNDNDTRLDTELKTLSAAVRARMRAEYLKVAPEDRAGRGLSVYLLGRNLETEADVQFLKDVIQEKPCLSLNDCSRDSGPARGEEVHLESTNDVSLHYPQLKALQAADRWFSDHAPDRGDGSVRRALEDLVRSALSAPQPLVRRLAESISANHLKSR